MLRVNNKNHSILLKSLFFSVCTLAACCAWARPVISIDDTVRQALLNSPEISMAGNTVAAKEEYLTAEKRKSWPTLKAELTALRGSGEPTSFAAVVGKQDPDAPVIGKQTGNYGLGTVALTTPIYRNGAFFFQKTPLEIASAEAINLAQSDKEAKIVELTNLVAKAYLEGLSATEQLALQTQTLEKQQLRLEAVKKRVLAGLDTESDKLSVDAVVLERSTDVNATRRLETYQRMLIAQVIGQDADASIELVRTPENFPIASDFEKIVEISVDRHPLVRAQTSTVNIARSNLESERASRWPEVSFEVSHTEGGDFYTTGTNRFSAAAIKIDAPLVDSGQTSAKIRARMHEVDENLDQVAQLRIALKQNIYKSYYAYQNAIDTYEASKAAVINANYKQQESQAKRAKNQIDWNTLLQDESAALVAQENQVKLRYAAWSAWADFLKALGLPYSSSFVAVQL